jgi:hypothetical protein
VVKRIVLACSVLAIMNACSSGASFAPKGWQPIAGQPNAWSTGSGSTLQEYRYDASSFGGMLSDLASQVAIDALIRHRGTKLQTNPFGPCPGAAGLATVRLYAGKVLQEGFTVRNGQAVRVRYVRPAEAPIDPNVTQAMRAALCPF